ncbi:MAG: ankyrin repeat domain-containing protein [Gammaproteobacteria bacterium]|nr:ankyrin repeat domain-containing protein [Gammaproteobacteria bacterium]
MLEILERFIIKYTIPKLNKKFISPNLSFDEKEKLDELCNKNRKLISGYDQGDYELLSIKHHFLEVLEKRIGKGNHHKKLPLPLQKIDIISLKMMAWKRANKLGLIVDQVNLPEEIKQIIIPHVQLKPYGSLGPIKADRILRNIYRLLDLERNNSALNLTKIKSAIEIAFILNASKLKNTLFDKIQLLPVQKDVLITLLKWAIEYNDTISFNRLFESTESLNNDDILKLIPSSFAGNSEIFNLLSSKVSTERLKTTLLLHVVAESGDIKKLRDLLDQGFPPLRRDENGWLPLHYAIRKGKIKAFKILHPLVADQLTETDHYQLFYCAAINNRLKSIDYLIKNKFNLNAKVDNTNIITGLLSHLYQEMNREEQAWGLAYRTYDESISMIESIISTNSQLVGNKYDKKISENLEMLASIKHKHSTSNFSKKSKALLDHPAIGGDLSLYQRYYGTYKGKVTDAFTGALSAGSITTLLLGVAVKVSAKSSKSHETANIILSLGVVAIVLDLMLLYLYYSRRSRVPCTNFFKNTPPAPENNDQGPVIIVRP